MDIVCGQTVALIQRGELVFVETFEAWYSREHERMIATLALSTGDIELAVEGVDEACSRALERWKRISAMESPTGWVYRVAINHARRVAPQKYGTAGFSKASANARPSRSRWRDLEVSRVTVGTSTTSCHVASRRRNERERDWHGVGYKSRDGFKHSARRQSAIGPPARRRKRTLGDYACHN